MFKKLIGASVGLAIMGVAGTANASLIGQTITCSGIGIWECGSSTAVVGGGSEFLLEPPDGSSFETNNIGCTIQYYVNGFTIYSQTFVIRCRIVLVWKSNHNANAVLLPGSVMSQCASTQYRSRRGSRNAFGHSPSILMAKSRD